MKLSIISALGFAASALAYPSYDKRQDLPEGVWQAPGPNDLRAPCPFMNSMANHGHFPRDGRNITFAMMEKKFLEVMGLSPEMTAILAIAALTVRDNETSVIFGVRSNFGTRAPGEKLDDGEVYINLDQLDRHGAIEHDASLVRLDYAQGDNHNIQPYLVDQFLAASSDGQHITQEDMGHFRRKRFQDQKAANLAFHFTPKEETIAFGEVGLVVGLFGEALHNFRVPNPYINALFREQRIPYAEGWNKRTIPLTAAETAVHLAYIKAVAGIFGS